VVNRVSPENTASLFGVHVRGNMMFDGTTAGYCENRKKGRNIGQQNKEILNV
jgi:hypothetical protein